MSGPISSQDLLKLTGKVAIVTGASQGIGAAIATRLAEAGAQVLIHYRNNKTDAEKVLVNIENAGGTASLFSADLSNSEDAQKLMSTALEVYSGLDILINNAGIFPNKSLLEMSHEEWSAMYSANMETAFLCTKFAAEKMREHHSDSDPGCSITNIASISASSPADAHSHYNSSKAALVMFTRSAAKELGQHGIRVNAVSPGLTNREGLDQQWPEGVQRWLEKSIIKRLGEPEDIADACLFLSSSAARFITGHNLIVDGGMMSADLY